MDSPKPPRQYGRKAGFTTKKPTLNIPEFELPKFKPSNSIKGRRAGFTPAKPKLHIPDFELPKIHEEK